MKVKVLRKKDTKEFVDIITNGQMHLIFTTEYPRLMTIETTIDLLIEYYNKPDFNYLDFSNFELIEFDLIESSEVIANIRNKLTSSLNLTNLIELYLNEKDNKKKKNLKKHMMKEIRQIKKNIEYFF